MVDEVKAAYCVGCLNKDSCVKQHDDDETSKMTPVRIAYGKKYFPCHNLAAVRPPYDNKEARRRFGEAAVHY